MNTTLTNRFTGRSTKMRIDMRGQSKLWSAPAKRLSAALTRIGGSNQPVRSSESFIAFDANGNPAQTFDAAE